ncbi:MAG TPA: hypothetical protein VLC11_01155 [Gemmatimonadales bacterium]|nr:hypothetical protein [Gemmatimonadales bacterium]
MRHVRWSLWLTVGALACTPTLAVAQLAPVGTPKGLIRLELGGGFTSADSRYLDGVEQDLAGDWNGTIGSTMLPGLATAEQQIRQLSGNSNYNLSLGRASVLSTYQAGRTVIGMSYGLTSRLSFFGRIPIIRVRTQETLKQDSASANAGFNPADPVFGSPTGAADATTFFSGFNSALTTLAGKIAAGDYDANPTEKALAQQTLATGTALRDGLYGLIVDPAGASPVLPVATSAAGLAILSQITSLQGTLSGSLGVSGFASLPDLPAQRFGPGDFTNLLTNPLGPGNALLLDGMIRNRQGDAELGATYTLVDHWREDGGTAFRLAATGLVRLPTGIVPVAGILFDRGTGDGQTDIEGSLVADVGRGSLGARITADYNDQLPGTVTRRVAAPTAALAWASTTAPVRWDPGNEFTLTIAPYFRLVDGFAATGGATFWNRGSDQVSYAAAPTPGAPPAALLALDTKASATMLEGGFLFSSSGARGGKGLPVEAHWTYQFVASASAGRVDKTRRTAIEFRVYYRVR